MRYTKKPVTIEAFCWTGDEEQGGEPTWAVEAIKSGTITFENSGSEEVKLCVATDSGVMRAERGDWIIRGIQGELYPCKPDIFEATYAPAVETSIEPMAFSPETLDELQKLADSFRDTNYFHSYPNQMTALGHALGFMRSWAGLPRGMRRAIAEITAERGRQDGLWGGPNHDKNHTAAEWILMGLEHLGKASHYWFAGRMVDVRRKLVCVAALMLAGLEHAVDLQTGTKWWRPDGEEGPLPAIEPGTETEVSEAGSREPGAGSLK